MSTWLPRMLVVILYCIILQSNSLQNTKQTTPKSAHTRETFIKFISTTIQTNTTKSLHTTQNNPIQTHRNLSRYIPRITQTQLQKKNHPHKKYKMNHKYYDSTN